jgi:hypothetical protein
VPNGAAKVRSITKSTKNPNPIHFFLPVKHPREKVASELQDVVIAREKA